jgi:hypothetical protein
MRNDLRQYFFSYFIILFYKSTIRFVDLCEFHTNSMMKPINLMVNLLILWDDMKIKI